MKLRYKIINSIFALIAILVVSLAVVMGYTADCDPRPAGVIEGDSMKAITYRCYGGPEVLEYGEVAKPVPAANEVLVKVVAAGVNPLDYHYMRGTPYLLRLMGAGVGAPTQQKMGVDFSGVVESVGQDVTQFKVGDEVFGGKKGAFAEYLVIPEDNTIAIKPDNVTHNQAAGVAIAAVTALQALRDLGEVQSGDKVLINGASGGVGTFAVQIAKYLGAEVTGVNSARNRDMVLGIGADRVIDYKTQDYTTESIQYDAIIDMVANHSIAKNMSVLVSDGRMVNVGAIEKGNWIGPLIKPIKSNLMNPLYDQEIKTLFASMSQEDLNFLAQMMSEGRLTPVMDVTYPLAQASDAVAYSETGRARGKIIITIN